MGLAGEQMCPLNPAAAGGEARCCLQGESAGKAQAGMLSPANSRPRCSEPGKEKCSVRQQPLVGRSTQMGWPLRMDPTSPREPTLAVPTSSARAGPAQSQCSRHKGPQEPRTEPTTASAAHPAREAAQRGRPHAPAAVPHPALVPG